MRISERHVIQIIDGSTPDADRLVFIDDVSGDEVVIPRGSWRLLQHAITYLTGDQYGVQQGTHDHYYEPTPVGRNGSGDAVVISECVCGSVGGVESGRP